MSCNLITVIHPGTVLDREIFYSEKSSESKSNTIEMSAKKRIIKCLTFDIYTCRAFFLQFYIRGSLPLLSWLTGFRYD